MRVSLRLFLLGLVAGCGTSISQSSTTICTASGSNPPTDCAVLAALAVDVDGDALRLIPVRVDSMIPGVGAIYASALTTTAADGTFGLLVSRVRRVAAPSVPDTASVEVKTYDPQTQAVVGRALIKMNFVPIGEQVIPTIVARATFDHPNAP